MKTVIVIEDDRLLRESTARVIDEASGCQCICACSTAEEALRKIPQLIPDVVLMDITLPKMSGIECARRIKIKNPSINVLMMAVNEDSEQIMETFKAGASGCLLKEEVEEKIVEAISDVKAGDAFISSKVSRKIIDSLRAPTPLETCNPLLSGREQEILTQLSKGYANKEIASLMYISPSTVRTHLRHIYKKLRVRCRTEAVVRFAREYTDAAINGTQYQPFEQLQVFGSANDLVNDYTRAGFA